MIVVADVLAGADADGLVLLEKSHDGGADMGQSWEAICPVVGCSL